MSIGLNAILLIVVGMITEMSIGRLFIAGLVTGVVLALILCLATDAAVKINPHLAPRVKGVSWARRFSSLRKVWGFLFLAVSITVNIHAGIATPTEYPPP